MLALVEKEHLPNKGLPVLLQIMQFSRYCRKFVAGFVVLSMLSACTASVSKSNFNDPYEKSSRKMHKFNIAFDKALVNPASKGYVTVTPPVFVRMIGNFASFLGLPLQALNNILQGNPKALAQTVSTAAVNAFTFGLGDLASEAGIPDNNADFGQTLSVWKFKQGIYYEMPIIGPSTTRDTVGFFIDLVINPLNLVGTSSEHLASFGFTVLDKLGKRSQYSDFYNETLYGSEDSYATARSLYLQNRNYFLNNGVNENTLEDPFAFN